MEDLYYVRIQLHMKYCSMVYQCNLLGQGSEAAQMCGGWEACSWQNFMFGRMTAQVYQNVGRKSFGVSV